MEKNPTQQLIKTYFNAFNSADMERFIELLAPDVIHDINQGSSEIGKSAFLRFMDHMNTTYKEEIHDLIILTSEDGAHACARYNVSGHYLKTDKGLPPAKGQPYFLPAASLFEVNANRITRVTTYYNLQDWLKQVST